jgi:hypothetical protein
VVAVSRRAVRIVASIVAASLVGSCGGGEPDTAILFEVQAVPGLPWIATGELVDAGSVCPAGGRAIVQFYDRAGTPLSFEEGTVRGFEYAECMDAGGPGSECDVDLLGEMEWTCADGSGSFRLLETTGGGEWQVAGGTGAFAVMTGEGTSELVFAPAPEHPDDPAEGELLGERFTGTLDMGGD